MRPSDQDLIGRIRERDAAAFDTLFERYRNAIRRHIVRTVQDESVAEDLLQEVFLRIWTCAAQWNARGEFRAWLYRIATNLTLNHLRAVRRRRQQPLEMPQDEIYEEKENPGPSPGWMIDASSAGPYERLEQAEQYELIQRLVDGLPEEKREVVRLVYEMEMDIREAAAMLRIPEGTVKSRLHYTMKRLAREWKEIAIEWEE